MTNAILLNNLVVRYGNECAVDRLTGAFPAGRMTALVGPNGAGKSTLLGAVAGTLTPASGDVRFCAGTRAEVAYLPQQAGVDREFPVTVLDVVMLGLWRRVGALAGVSRVMRNEATRALATVGLEDCAGRSISELSVGQFQRVRFARILLQRAHIVLLDEPFNAVDARTTSDLLALLHAWRDEGCTIIAVLHDLELVRAHFTHVLLLARKSVAWGETESVLSHANLMRARVLSDDWGSAVSRRVPVGSPS